MSNPILISIPKSGCHLMKHILGLEDNFNWVDSVFFMEPAGLAYITQRHRVYPKAMTGHIVYCYGARIFYKHGTVMFLRRHPGDIIVSWWNYMKVADVASSEYVLLPKMLDNAEYKDKLRFLLSNLYDFFRVYLGWMDEPIHKLKYEDLLHDPRETLAPVAADLGMDLDGMVERSRFRGGPTFRKGVSGEWKQVLVGQYYDLFKKNYAHIAERLGYEI